MNAFDLASRLMAGKLAPLMSGGPSVKSNTRFMANASVIDTIERLEAFLKSIDIDTQVKKDVSVVSETILPPSLSLSLSLPPWVLVHGGFMMHLSPAATDQVQPPATSPAQLCRAHHPHRSL